MEGVGARLGRSSSRYGPTTVFTGPVRRWKKKWVHVPPPNSNHRTAANGAVDGGNGASHLLLFKWTPIAPGQTKDSGHSDNNGDAESSKNDVVAAAEEPPRRKFKYIPIVVLEEQKDESSEQMEDESKPIDTDTNNAETSSKSDGYDEKPDINDVPMDENQAMEKNPVERQDLNVSTLDLSLGLNAHDDDGDDDDDDDDESDSKADKIEGF